ncbi:MAG: hypothetical protein U9P79_08025 [Candidatus Cloacimonadota bacterium]|nr:hypothetical protein [Candidatus Cloacimonadota bacterium]
MKKSIYLFILLNFFLALPLPARKNTIEDIQLNDSAFISEIQKHLPWGNIKIFNTSHGRFAAVYKDSLLSFVLSTADHSELRGYKGYSNLLIFISSEGTVERITFVDSDDTKPWVKRVLKSDILSALSMQNLDTQERPNYLVTGATVTSEVFSKSVKQTLEWFKNFYSNLEVQDPKFVIADSLNIYNK